MELRKAGNAKAGRLGVPSIARRPHQSDARRAEQSRRTRQSWMFGRLYQDVLRCGQMCDSGGAHDQGAPLSDGVGVRLERDAR